VARVSRPVTSYKIVTCIYMTLIGVHSPMYAAYASQLGMYVC